MVDVMNVVGCRPDGWWRDRPAAIERLLDDLVALASPVWAFVDAHPTGRIEEREFVLVHYTGTGPDAADDAIVVALEALPHPDEATVVTSDRELLHRVRALGAVTVGASNFRRRLDQRLSTR